MRRVDVVRRARMLTTHPPNHKDKNEAPAERQTQTGADFGYDRDGNPNNKTNDTGVQAWQRDLPANLVVLVGLHRMHRPAEPLPQFLQRAIADVWVHQ